MIEAISEKDRYIADFEELEKELGGRGPASLRRLRKAAIARFAEIGFPTARNEDWKFTNVAPLAKIAFKPASREADEDARLIKELSETAGKVEAEKGIIFVNGACHEPLQGGGLPGGVLVQPLGTALHAHADKIEPYLARHAKYEDHPFTALNTAFFGEGAFVYVPKGVVLDQPIYLVYLSTAHGEPAVSYPRNLIVVESNSQVTIVESYAGRHGDIYFSNAVSEIAARPNAVVDHYKLQRESEQAFHIAHLQVHQERSSKLSSHYIGLGGSLVRNEVRVLLDGEGCECTLNGLYMAGGRQHIDNHTVIDHARPRCASHELYKGILSGKAHGVFNGKIFVRQDAQKTDAKQTNQTLLLSDDATINTKPQLEIYADDVKCTHGATVGQLDEDAIFYLRSRGIDLEAARSLLTYAFANDIIGRIKIEPVRAQLEHLLLTAQGLPSDQLPRESP